MSWPLLCEKEWYTSGDMTVALWIGDAIENTKQFYVPKLHRTAPGQELLTAQRMLSCCNLPIVNADVWLEHVYKTGSAVLPVRIRNGIVPKLQ